MFVTFGSVSISTGRNTTQRRLRNFALGYGQLTLSEAADYWRAVIASPETEPGREEFARRQLAKVQESIGVTLGLRRPGRK